MTQYEHKTDAEMIAALEQDKRTLEEVIARLTQQQRTILRALNVMLQMFGGPPNSNLVGVVESRAIASHFRSES